MLELKLFGHMELSGPGGKIELANAKLSALLAYLALSGRRPLPRDQLTNLLWGSHFEEQARQNFRQALSRLRKLLGSDLFVAEDQFIQIEAGKIESDVARFESFSSCEPRINLSRPPVCSMSRIVLAAIRSVTLWPSAWLKSRFF